MFLGRQILSKVQLDKIQSEQGRKHTLQRHVGVGRLEGIAAPCRLSYSLKVLLPSGIGNGIFLIT